MGSTKGAVTIHLITTEPRDGEGVQVENVRRMMIVGEINMMAAAKIAREGDESVRFNADLFVLADDLAGADAIDGGMTYLRETYPMIAAFGVELAVTLVRQDGTSVAVI